jgi:hypothetical protein
VMRCLACRGGDGALLGASGDGLGNRRTLWRKGKLNFWRRVG